MHQSQGIKIRFVDRIDAAHQSMWKRRFKSFIAPAERNDETENQVQRRYRKRQLCRQDPTEPLSASKPPPCSKDNEKLPRERIKVPVILGPLGQAPTKELNEQIQQSR